MNIVKSTFLLTVLPISLSPSSVIFHEGRPTVENRPEIPERPGPRQYIPSGVVMKKSDAFVLAINLLYYRSYSRPRCHKNNAI